MLIFRQKYILCKISPYIEFHDGTGQMTERFEDAMMYDSKEYAEKDMETWDEDAKEGIKAFPVEITCRL